MFKADVTRVVDQFSRGIVTALEAKGKIFELAMEAGLDNDPTISGLTGIVQFLVWDLAAIVIKAYEVRERDLEKCLDNCMLALTGVGAEFTHVSAPKDQQQTLAVAKMLVYSVGIERFGWK